MKWLLTIFLFGNFYFLSFSQSNYWNKPSPYEINWKKGVGIGGTSIGVHLLGMHLEKNEEIPNFQPGSFTQQDIDAINFLDRGVAGRWDIDAKDAGKIFKFSAKYLAPAAVLSLPGNLKSRLLLGAMFMEGRFLAGGLTALAKGTTNRYRPYTYLSLEQIEQLEGEAKEEFTEDIADDDIEDSFFSGDATATAYGMIFFAKVFNDYYPESKWRYAVWAGSITATTLGAYFRAKSGKHFPTDVIVGALVGGSLGYLIPHLHKKKKVKGFSFQTTQNGIGLCYLFK